MRFAWRNDVFQYRANAAVFAPTPNFGREIGLAHVKELTNGKQNVGLKRDRHGPRVRRSGSGYAY